jgi:hypothetical protein
LILSFFPGWFSQVALDGCGGALELLDGEGSADGVSIGGDQLFEEAP